MTTVATDNKALLAAIGTLTTKVDALNAMLTIQDHQHGDMRSTLDSLISMMTEAKKTSRPRAAAGASADGAPKASKPIASAPAFFQKRYVESEALRAKFAKHIATIHANAKYETMKAKGDAAKTLQLEASLVFTELVGKLSEYEADKVANIEEFKAYRAKHLKGAGQPDAAASATTSLAAAAVMGTPAPEAAAAAAAPAKPGKKRTAGKTPAKKPVNATITDDATDEDIDDEPTGK